MANTAGSITPRAITVTAAAGSKVYDGTTSTTATVTITPGGVVTTLAGSPGQTGSANGTGAAAAFNVPGGAAVDSVGNVYVADQHNDEIRKITPAGVVTTLAGAAGQIGSSNGSGSAARFYYPSSVAVDSVGNVYVADQYNDEIRKITPSGVVTTLAGSAGLAGSSDGTGSAARFYLPCGVAVDSVGNVYVADDYNGEVRKISPTGVVTTMAVGFGRPTGVAVDSAGNVYMADQGNEDVCKITPSGVVTTLAGSAGQTGSSDGSGSAARFDYPSGVAVDNAGNVYVADEYNDEIREISPSAVVTTLAGFAGQPGSTDGILSAARFGYPTGVAVDSAGNVYVADQGNQEIRLLSSTLLPGDMAAFSETFDIRIVGSGKTLRATGSVNDGNSGNNYAVTFASNTSGQITARAITVTASASTKGYDGTTSSAATPTSPSIAVVTTLAGSAGQIGSSNGTGSAARFDWPNGVAVNSAGNVYVADALNDEIREITPSGVVSTFAGSAGQAGSSDGTGSAARFHLPNGVAVDNAGNVYVADSHNDEIRKITSSGVVTTMAGAAGQTGSSDGTGSAARFDAPTGVAADNAGNVYVADEGNDEIREITLSGAVTTLAGAAGQIGSSNGNGSAARFYGPSGTAVDSAGNVYVADYENYEIRVVSSNAGLVSSDTAAFTDVFDTKNVGTRKTLTPAGSVNDGNGGSNYAVTLVANTTGQITPLAITVTAASSTKTYDGTISSTATPRITTGSLGSGNAPAFAETFTSKNTGTGKTLTAAGLVNDGNGGSNYTVTLVPSATGSVAARAITVTAAGSTKGYDGTTSSAATPTITAGSMVSGDTAAFSETFDTPALGTGKTLTPAGSVNDGNGGNDYAVTFVVNTTGAIVVSSTTLTWAGPGNVLSLTESISGNTPAITISEPTTGVSLLKIDLGAGCVFAAGSTISATGLTYQNAGSPTSSEYAMIDISTAGNVSSLVATLPGDGLTLGPIRDTNGGLGSITASAGTIEVTGISTTSVNGNVNLAATANLTVDPGDNILTGTGMISLAADVNANGTGDDGVGTLSIDAGAVVDSTNSSANAITLRGAAVNIDTSANPAFVGSQYSQTTAPVATLAGLLFPLALAFDAGGSLYVVNSNNTVSKFAPGADYADRHAHWAE